MNRTVLVADGDSELCDLYQMVLGDYGYKVEIAEDGLDCLKKLRRLTPAALVLDLELRWGGSDGILDWLRHEDPTHEVPVILTCTAGFPRQVADLISQPVVDSLLKPFTVTALLESIGSAVERKGKRESFNTRRVPEHLELVIR